VTEERWRLALEIYLAAAEMPKHQRESYLGSASIDPEMLLKVAAALEDSESRASAADPGTPGPGVEAPRIGTQVGRYLVTTPLGHGGMGEVYSAQDGELGRTVALKFLGPHVLGAPSAVERFVREAKAASALNHPNIVTVYEVIQSEAVVAIAMELVEGTTLRRLCRNPLPVDQVIHLGQQMADALAAAHIHGIVHRDVKPENIMVRRDGYVKVLDFGLARQISADTCSAPGGLPVGTLQYMSPEQARGQPLTASSDVFALGLVLYELLAGRHPFAANSALEIALAIASEQPPAPSSLNAFISPCLDSLILSMLAKDHRVRPSAQDVAAALAGIRGPSGEISAPGKAPDRSHKTRKWLLAAGSAVLLAGSLLAWYAREPMLSAREPAFLQLTREVSENRVTAAAISADGRSLACAEMDGSLFLRAIDNSAIRPLPGPKSFRIETISWFADGSRLLVSGHATDTEEPGVWVVSAGQGKTSHKLIEDAEKASPSPDGKQVLFTRKLNSEIWVKALDGAQPRKLVAGAWFPVVFWSLDGKSISYQRVDPAGGWDRRENIPSIVDRSFESLNVETGQVIDSMNGIRMTSACLLSNGRVLFSWPDSTASETQDNLYELRTDLRTGRMFGSPRRIAQVPGALLSNITSSANGKEILVVRTSSRPDVYVGNLRSPHGLNDIRRFTLDESTNFPHAWTSDSSAVIFESNRNGHLDLFRQGMNERGAQPIVTTQEDKYMAQVSPDGEWLLYASAPKIGSANQRLMRVPVRGGNPQAVPIGPVKLDEFRCALPIGKRCILRSMENRQYVFYELDPILGKRGELARTPWTRGVAGDWALSPDGSLVAIPVHDLREPRIHLVSLDPSASGAQDRDLHISGLPPMNGLNWSADGRGWFAVVSNNLRSEWFLNGSKLVYVGLDGHVERLREFAGTTFAVPSPDGNHLAFVDYTISSNAWVQHR
jgi:serine/threonine protein kinase